MSQLSKINEPKLPFGIEITQFVYLILSVLGTVSLAFQSFYFKRFDIEFFERLLFVIVFWAMFYGTYYARSWVVTLVLVISAFSSITGIIEVLTFKPITNSDYVKKGFNILVTSFLCFN